MIIDLVSTYKLDIVVTFTEEVTFVEGQKDKVSHVHHSMVKVERTSGLLNHKLIKK